MLTSRKCNRPSRNYILRRKSDDSLFFLTSYVKNSDYRSRQSGKYNFFKTRLRHENVTEHPEILFYIETLISASGRLLLKSLDGLPASTLPLQSGGSRFESGIFFQIFPSFFYFFFAWPCAGWFILLPELLYKFLIRYSDRFEFYDLPYGKFTLHPFAEPHVAVFATHNLSLTRSHTSHYFIYP